MNKLIEEIVKLRSEDDFWFRFRLEELLVDYDINGNQELKDCRQELEYCREDNINIEHENADLLMEVDIKRERIEFLEMLVDQLQEENADLQLSLSEAESRVQELTNELNSLV
jgi:chromosome segregation ATPase